MKLKATATKLFTLFLVIIILLASTTSVDARRGRGGRRRGGGRVGGSSFSRPRSSSPVSPYRSTPGSGGGVFVFPFFSGDGSMFGGIFGLIVLLGIAAAVINAFMGNSGEGITSNNTKVTIAKIQIGLLATARQLQQDLNYLAMEADTSTSAGLANVLSETTLALLRHPEYWVYVSSALEQTNFGASESKYNQLLMSERTKLSEEVLTNHKGKKILKSAAVSDSTDLASADWEAPSEYIVVTIVAAFTGDHLANVPNINDGDTLRTALMGLGAVNPDQLVALEILWEPQSEGYTLTADDMLTVYPDLLRI